jgi:hypothetical protein
MNCVTEDFIRLHRYRKPEKIEFLHSMLESRLSLYEITQTDKEEGFIWLRDVFTGAEHKITDIALSDARGTADIYLYTRVITYRDVKFSSGFTLIFIKADGFIQKFIELNRKDYKPEAELLRFSELYNHFTNDPEHYKIIVNELK